MSTTVAARRGPIRPELLLLLALAAAVPCYALLITNGSFDLVVPASSLVRDARADLNFNSMLDHMLRGQFDVDPAIVGGEGFAHGGKVYTYFGPFLGLLRLPLVPFGSLLTLDVTPLSCLLAICLGATMKLQALLVVHRRLPASRLGTTLFAALSLSVLAGGPQVQLLRSSMFQEAVLWAGALASIFVFLAIRALVRERRFSAATIGWMALVAGLALLTRVTIGIGLYAALGGCMLVLAWRDARTPRDGMAALLAPKFLLGAGILACFALACGFVNYERWGSPFVFAPFHQQILTAYYPKRDLVEARYGDLNPIRIPFGLQYYFLPIWAIWSHGRLIFDAFQENTMMMVELPPSSLLLTDPLLFLLAGWAIQAWRRRGAPLARGPAAALALGLAVPAVLMTMASATAFRYRVEFFPLLEFLAFTGFYLRVARGQGQRPGQRALIWVLTVIGIGASMASLAVYRLSPFGPASAALSTDPVTYYRAKFEHDLDRIGAGSLR